MTTMTAKINKIATPMTLKEGKDYATIKLSIARIDMERAELVKKLRATPKFALELINERLKLLFGKYFSTPNSELIYNIVSGTVEYLSIIKPLSTTQRTNNRVLSKSKELFPAMEYVVVLNITKYDKTGKSTPSTYKINSSELPKDVDKWLYMGNSEISKGEAKDYLTKALNAEKKALEARIKEINLIIK